VLFNGSLNLLHLIYPYFEIVLYITKISINFDIILDILISTLYNAAMHYNFLISIFFDAMLTKQRYNHSIILSQFELLCSLGFVHTSKLKYRTM